MREWTDEIVDLFADRRVPIWGLVTPFHGEKFTASAISYRLFFPTFAFFLKTSEYKKKLTVKIEPDFFRPFCS